MNFPQRLRDLRKEHDLIAKDLAKKLGFTTSTVYEWEKGRSEPSLRTLLELSNLFNVSIYYLLGLEDDFGNIVIAGDGESLTDEEKELVRCYRSSADAERLALLTTARSFAKRKTDAKHNVG